MQPGKGSPAMSGAEVVTVELWVPSPGRHRWTMRPIPGRHRWTMHHTPGSRRWTPRLLANI